MSFEQALSTSLAAAVGDDQALVAELRGAFIDSAERHMKAMQCAATDSDWSDAALRLKGLAASFGATSLLDQADRAANARRGDAAVLGDLERGLAVIAL
jgi:HPt (histidine-containing phosphotransfer) domain-containing protein